MSTLPTRRGVIARSGVGYAAEAEALFARFTTPASDTDKGHINTYIEALKACGAWALMDCLSAKCLATEQAAQRNWKQDLYNLTAVGSPTFVPYRGHTLNGTTQYETTGYTPGVSAASQATQDSAHLMLYCLTDSDAATIDVGGSNFFIFPRSSGNMRSRIHNAATADVAVAASSGCTIISRGVAGSYARNKDGTELAAGVVTSAAPANSPVLLGARNTNTAGGVTAASFTTRELAVMSMGGHLTDEVMRDAVVAATAAFVMAMVV